MHALSYCLFVAMVYQCVVRIEIFPQKNHSRSSYQHLLPRTFFFHTPNASKFDISSDGQWLAFVSFDVSIPMGVYVRKLPDGPLIRLPNSIIKTHQLSDLEWAFDNSTLLLNLVVIACKVNNLYDINFCFAGN